MNEKAIKAGEHALGILRGLLVLDLEEYERIRACLYAEYGGKL